MSGLFEGKKKTPEVAAIADPYQKVREPLLDWLGKSVGKPGEQYSGGMVAPPSQYGKESLDYLRQYARGGETASTQGAKTYLQDIVGKYKDPASSPYYQSVKAEAGRLKEQGMKDIEDIAAGGGRYWTGARMGEQAGYGKDIDIGLMNVLGKLAESYSGQQLQAAPMLAGMGQYEEGRPLRAAGALQDMGEYERNIEQSKMQAIYQEWLRATQDRPMQMGQLAAGVEQAPLYGRVETRPSTLAAMLGETNPFMGSYNTHKHDYSTNQMSMSDAIKMMLGGM